MFHKTHITSISDFLLSSTWYVSQDSYHFNQWFPVVLKLRCFTRFISLQSVISCCPQIEMFHKIHITSVSDFLLSSNWNVSQDSYHFSQWFPAVLNLRCFTRFISLHSVIPLCPQLEIFHKIHITSVSDFLLSSTWDLSKVLSLQSVISCCPQIEMFHKIHITSTSDFLLSSTWDLSKSLITSVRDFLLSSNWDVSHDSYHFSQWFPVVLNLRSFKSLITSISDFLLSSTWDLSKVLSLQSVISYCPQIEMFRKTHITSISNFLLSSTWDVSQDLYHFIQWFPAVLKLKCFTRFISLQSVISCCPQIEMFHRSYHFSQWFPIVLNLRSFTRVLSFHSGISYCPQLEMFHKIYITSFSDFQLSSNWNVSQDSYHFYQWFPIVINLRSFKSLITSVSDFLLSSIWDLSQVLSLLSVISYCPQLEIFHRIYITSFSDFLLSSNWNVLQDAYHFNQWFPAVLKLKYFGTSICLHQWSTAVLNLRCFKIVISLHSVISCCPQLEIFHKMHIYSISNFLLFST
jgi:hypothetical protein